MSESRLFFAALPPTEVVQAFSGVIIGRHQLDQRLGRAFFVPENWHQSLSERFFSPTDAQREAMLRAGARVSAHACTLQFNRIDSSINQNGRIHWTLQGQGKPKAFAALIQSMHDALEAEGLEGVVHNPSPHITLSYSASELLREKRIDMQPALRWTIDELLLVIGGGKPYRYEVIGSWPLLPEIDPPATQMGLF